MSDHPLTRLPMTAPAPPAPPTEVPAGVPRLVDHKLLRTGARVLPPLIHPAYQARRSRLCAGIFARARQDARFNRSLTRAEARQWAADLVLVAAVVDAADEAPLGEAAQAEMATFVAVTTARWSHAPEAQSRRRREGWRRYLEAQAPHDTKLAERHAAGDTYQSLATEHGCSFSGMRKRVARGRKLLIDAGSGSVAPPYRLNPDRGVVVKTTPSPSESESGRPACTLRPVCKPMQAQPEPDPEVGEGIGEIWERYRTELDRNMHLPDPSSPTITDPDVIARREANKLRWERMARELAG